MLLLLSVGKTQLQQFSRCDDTCTKQKDNKQTGTLDCRSLDTISIMATKCENGVRISLPEQAKVKKIYEQKQIMLARPGGDEGTRLAEGGEGESEARLGGSGVKPYYLDYVVNSQSETNDRRWWGWRRSCRSVVSAKAVKPHHVNMEISVAWAAGQPHSISFRFSALGGKVSYTASPRTPHTDK